MISLDQLISEARAQAKRKKRTPTPPKPRTRNQASAQSPYRAVALVLPIREITCSCGAKHTYPEGGILVQFAHRRSSTTLYIADHPARLNSNLPQRILVNRSCVTHCQACFTETPEPTGPWLFPEVTINNNGSGQRELRLLPDSPPPRHSTEVH